MVHLVQLYRVNKISFNRVSSCFSFEIFEITRCWHKLASEEMSKYGLKGPHATYLMALLKYENGITAPQICELCGKDKADVSRMMSIMGKKGLVVNDAISLNNVSNAIGFTVILKCKLLGNELA